MKKFNLLALSFFIFSLNLAFSQAPELVAPEDEDNCVPILDTRFEWNLTNVPNDYTFQVTDKEGDYSAPVLERRGLTNKFYDLDDGDLTVNSGTFYWRVTARYSNTTSTSEEFMFVTQRTGPMLGDPADGLTCSPASTTFNWSDIGNVQSYNIELSISSNFNTIESSTNSGTMNTIAITPENGYNNYYWRVNAYYVMNGETCVTEWSDISQFRSSVYSPLLTSPLDNANGVAFNTLLEWSQANGATSYNFELATSNTFGSDVILAEDGTNNLEILANLDPTKFNEDYWWRVQSIESNTCISEWSTAYKFTTALESTTLTSPADLTECVDISDQTFSWIPIGNSNTYQFQLSRLTGFLNPEIDIEDIEDNSITIDVPDDNTVYYWRVRSNTGENVSAWSERFEFLSGIFNPMPDLPADGEEDTFIALTLEWDNESNFSRQRLMVAGNDDFDEESIVIDVTELNENEYFAVLPEYEKEYYWRVSSTLGDCESGWSEVSSFTTYDGKPNLTFPEDEEINLPLQIVFEWDEVQFAELYDIQLSLDENFSKIEKASFDIETTAIRFRDLKEKATYYWRVRSVNQYSKSPWSSVKSFETGLNNASKPVLIYPENNDEMIPVIANLKWEASENAVTYDLQISTEDEFEDVLIEQNTINSTTYTVTGLENFQTYYWRVRGQNQTTISSWSNFGRFRTIAPEITVPTNLERPLDGAGNIRIVDTEFEWEELSNTTDKEGGYQIQIASADDFSESNIILDVRNVFKTDPLINNLQATENYFWRVRGWNEAGDGPWSEVFEFSTLDPTSVQDNNISKVDIYPNPTAKDINLVFNLKEAGELELNIFDISGNNVAAINKGYIGDGENNVRVDELNLVAGKYLIMLKVGNSIVTYSFTVEK